MSSEANGANGVGGTAKVSRFDPTFTDKVIKATGPKANSRLAQVLPSLLRHLHDFCRENEITVDEYMAAVNMVSEPARMWPGSHSQERDARASFNQLTSDTLSR